MSLAMFAAPIDDNTNITMPNSNNENSDIISKKRHKKTQRKYSKIENFDTQKVNSILKKIHDTSESDDDENDHYDFNPPPKPESAGVQKTIPKTENFSGMDFPLGNKYIGKEPTPNTNSDELELNDYSNYGDKETVEKYYNRILPGYAQQKNKMNEVYHKNYINNPINKGNEYPTQDLLLQKLNYMITLLEDQQDEKTNNVTEEVILYSFLGIFIIFIADSFVRVGKYVR